MLLSQLQRGLEKCYDVRLPFSIEQFVSHDPDWLQATTGDSRGIEEVLLIREQPDALDVTLYLENGAVDNANAALRSGALDRQGLEAVCAVMEGVSHVVCLLWHAHHERQISALDLELQADVDKFVLLAATLAEGEDRLALHRRLFEAIRITAAQGSRLHERYRTANAQAASYCHWLNTRFMNLRDQRGLSRELARFYRLSGSCKRERIRRAPG